MIYLFEKYWSKNVINNIEYLVILLKILLSYLLIDYYSINNNKLFIKNYNKIINNTLLTIVINLEDIEMQASYITNDDDDDDFTFPIIVDKNKNNNNNNEINIWRMLSNTINTFI